MEEKNIYFYHPDHLGSSSYITDKEGKVIQHTEYMAFGEVLFDEHTVSPKQPYLFNGKELDYETGLYYYGARYYDPKVSLWLNVDPLVKEERFMYVPEDDEDVLLNGGGIFNPMNHSVYSYMYCFTRLFTLRKQPSETVHLNNFKKVLSNNIKGNNLATS